ncbi:unnamed protein product [Adineta ricciae]|uniref:Uncharacterized protein n=1 Tax=Adineta ricciae TaxID=249248 RepID=A0A815FV67_ADIRI|nr:unnamed protein product [Adineta ricciae]
MFVDSHVSLSVLANVILLMFNQANNGHDSDDSSSGYGSDSEQNLPVPYVEPAIELSQMAVDEPSDNSQGIANEIINSNILLDETRHLEQRTTTSLWTLYALFHIVFRQLSHLLLFALTRVPVYMILFVTRQMPPAMNFDRDAQAENRVAHPTDDDWQFSATISQPANEGNNENNANVLIPVQDGTNHLGTTNEYSVPEPADDNSTCNINPINAVQSHDGTDVNEYNDEHTSVGDQNGSIDNGETDSSNGSAVNNSFPVVRNSDATSDQIHSVADRLEDDGVPPKDVRDIANNIDPPIGGTEQLVADKPLVLAESKSFKYTDSTDAVSDETLA